MGTLPNLGHDMKTVINSFSHMALVVLFLGIGSTQAGVLIDFETIPGASPTNGLIISNQFKAAYGVTFRTIASEQISLVQIGTAADVFGFCLGAVGPPPNCTTGNHLYPDDPLAAAIGNYFISLGSGNPAQGFGLIVDLDTPVSQAGGVILDIDGSEQWTVRTYSDTNGATQTGQAVFTSGDPGTGDGRSTLWVFNHATADIQEIRFIYTGNPSGVGEGFDLFYLGQLPPDVPVLSISGSRQLSLNGRVAKTYSVQYSSFLPTTNWITVTNFTLPSSPFPIIETSATTNSSTRFYRAMGSP